MNDEAQRERQVRVWLEELQATQLSPHEQHMRKTQKKLERAKDLQVRAWLEELCRVHELEANANTDTNK